MLHGEKTGTKTDDATTLDDHDGRLGRVQFEIGHRIAAAVHRSHVRETVQAPRVRHHIQTQR